MKKERHKKRKVLLSDEVDDPVAGKGSHFVLVIMVASVCRVVSKPVM